MAVDEPRPALDGNAEPEPTQKPEPKPKRGSKPPSGPGPSTGVRLMAIAGLSALVLLSGTLLTRAGTSPPPPAPLGASVATGAWFCPHGGGPGWTGWIAIANPGPSPVRVRATTFGHAGVTIVHSFTVGASREVYRAVPVVDPASSTEVEYFGGWVAAGAVIRSSGASEDVAAERCVAGLRGSWSLPDATTATGEQASIVVVNPYASPAEFDVVIRTNAPRTIRPGALTPVVLKPRTATSVAVNPWALEGPNEDTVTVQIVPLVGGVIAGSLVVSPDGVRAEAGVPAASTRWILPAAGYAAPARLEVLNAGPARAVLTVVAQGSGGANTIPDATGVPIAAGTARTFDVGAVPDAGILVDSGKEPVVVALRVAGPNGGLAVLTGWTGPAERWIVPPALPSTGGTARVTLQNPGTAAATVRIEWIGPSGIVRSASTTVRIAPGRTVAVTAPQSAVPLFALVTATDGSIVAGETAQALASSGFAATSGIPVP